MALVQDPNTGQIYDDTRGIMIPDFLSRLENLPMPAMPTLNMQPPENLLNVSNEPQPFIDPKMTMRPEDARTIPQMQYIAAQNPQIPNQFPMKDAPVRTVPQTQTIKGPGNNLQATAQVPSVSKARADELRQQYGVDPTRPLGRLQGSYESRTWILPGKCAFDPWPSWWSLRPFGGHGSIQNTSLFRPGLC